MKKALVLAIVCAFGLGAGCFAQGALSGSWDASICLTLAPAPAPITLSSFESNLVVDYTISGWTFESTSTFTDAGWVSQVFTVDGVLGAFTLGSELVFDPANAMFQYWSTDATVNIAGVALEFQTILVDTDPLFTDCAAVIVPAGFGMAIGVSGGAQDLTFAATLYINSHLIDLIPACSAAGETWLAPVAGCGFAFTSVEFELTFPFCCIELVDVSLAFDCTGFGGITFCASDITFPNLPWLNFDICLTFDDGPIGKVLVITPALDLGDFACFTIYADLCEFEQGCFGGINIYGIGLECDFNGCTFSSLSYLDYPTHHIHAACTTTTYWESLSISCGGDSCCGGAFSFDVAIYFTNDILITDNLFDVGAISASLAFGISSNFDLTSDICLDTITGALSWCLGFAVTF